jgi:hypothetical protein
MNLFGIFYQTITQAQRPGGHDNSIPEKLTTFKSALRVFVVNTIF